MTGRPSRYPSRKPSPANVAASLAFHAPPPAPVRPWEETPAPAFPGSPEGHEARPDAERNRLLERITAARFHHRHLVELIVQVEGLDALSDDALRRAVKILDVIETTDATDTDKPDQ